MQLVLRTKTYYYSHSKKKQQEIMWLIDNLIRGTGASNICLPEGRDYWRYFDYRHMTIGKTTWKNKVDNKFAVTYMVSKNGTQVFWYCSQIKGSYCHYGSWVKELQNEWKHPRGC
jgi:hypothetical protein